MSKDYDAERSLSERPISHGPRRLADWLNPTGAMKVHSLVDKIYTMKNLEMAVGTLPASADDGVILAVGI